LIAFISPPCNCFYILVSSYLSITDVDVTSLLDDNVSTVAISLYNTLHTTQSDIL